MWKKEKEELTQQLVMYWNEITSSSKSKNDILELLQEEKNLNLKLSSKLE